MNDLDTLTLTELQSALRAVIAGAKDPSVLADDWMLRGIIYDNDYHVVLAQLIGIQRERSSVDNAVRRIARWVRTEEGFKF